MNDRHAQELKASMGPRSNDRGNVQPYRPGDVHGTASMGPRSNDRGNGGPLGSPDGPGRASMGPRSNDRGNGTVSYKAIEIWKASMGPRSNDRGNTAAAIRPRWAPLLQWGRDQMIAEMPSAIGPGLAPSALQWGRDQMIAEIERLEEFIVEAGDASMGPRSNDRGNAVRVQAMKLEEMLQWGRDQMIAEMRNSAKK